MGGEKGDVRSGKWEVGRRQNSGDRMQNTTDERTWNLELETLNSKPNTQNSHPTTSTTRAISLSIGSPAEVPPQPVVRPS